MGGFTVNLDNVQTCHLALKVTGDVGVRTVFDSLSGKVLHRTYQLCFFQCTITHDHSSIKHGGVIGKTEINLAPAADCFFLGFVTEQLADQHVIVLGFN